MRKIVVSLLLSIIALSSNVYAGLHATTVHSRANCINNESITWWLGHAYNWRVISIHTNTDNNVAHHIDTKYSRTWRQAAVHWREAPLGNKTWSVSGHHFLLEYAGGRYPFESTYVDNCSIYDGWWDY